MLPPAAVQRLAMTFKVLGDPTRIRVLDALSKDELCVCDLAVLLEMSSSAVSHQLRVLRDARLVKYRRAVSYTHLDVYKRQSFDKASRTLILVGSPSTLKVMASRCTAAGGSILDLTRSTVCGFIQNISQLSFPRSVIIGLPHP